MNLGRGMFQNSLDLGSKDQASSGLRVVQRLNSQAIAGDKKLSAARVPYGKSKHSAQVLDTFLSKIFIKVDDHFRIAGRRKCVAATLQLLPKFVKVVNFAVEDRDDGSIFIADGLLTSAQVNDAQAAHSDCQILVKIDPGIIRTAMTDDTEHVFQDVRLHRCVILVFVNTANATHGFAPIT